MKKTTIIFSLSMLLLGVAYAQRMPVSIEGMYPDSGQPGTTVVLKGRGFSLGDNRQVWASNLEQANPPGVVEFNGARAEVKLWQDNLIMVVVPPNASSGGVRVVLNSGLAVPGNHFEIVDSEGASNDRRDWSFLESKSPVERDAWMFSRGYYPSPYYFYRGYRPVYRGARAWDISRGCRNDGYWDFFLTSGPMLGACRLYTGMDDVLFFPGSFQGDYASRSSWWDGAVQPMYAPPPPRQQRQKYSFEE